MKKFLAITMAVCMIAFAFLSTAAVSNLGSSPVIQSNSTTNTATVNTNSPMAWPCFIAAGTTVTNVTKIDVSGGETVALQCTCSALQPNGGNVIVQLGRNIQGTSATNSVGTGMNIEWFATITNALPVDGTATSPKTVCYTFGPPTGAASGGTGATEGAVNAFYVGWITCPANLTLTNYYIWASVR